MRKWIFLFGLFILAKFSMAQEWVIALTRTNKICSYYFLAFLVLIGFCGSAQTKGEIAVAKKLFEGRWVNKKAKRHLIISFDTEYYATINDWTGKVIENVNSIDAYKAFVRQGKLVMPEDKTDLRAPYCEIVKEGNTLLYRCRGMNTKDQRFIDQVVFTRERE